MLKGEGEIGLSAVGCPWVCSARVVDGGLSVSLVAGQVGECEVPWMVGCSDKMMQAGGLGVGGSQCLFYGMSAELAYPQVPACDVPE